MTKDDFILLIETKKEFEFTYKGKLYTMTYGTDEKGGVYCPWTPV